MILFETLLKKNHFIKNCIESLDMIKCSSQENKNVLLATTTKGTKYEYFLLLTPKFHFAYTLLNYEETTFSLLCQRSPMDYFSM